MCLCFLASGKNTRSDITMLNTGMIEKNVQHLKKKNCCLSNKHFWQSKFSGKHRKRAGVKHCLLQSSTTICYDRAQQTQGAHEQTPWSVRQATIRGDKGFSGWLCHTKSGPIRRDQLHRKTHHKSFQVLWSKLPGLRVFLKGSCQGRKFGAALGGPTSPWNQSWWNCLILNRKTEVATCPSKSVLKGRAWLRYRLEERCKMNETSRNEIAWSKETWRNIKKHKET